MSFPVLSAALWPVRWILSYKSPLAPLWPLLLGLKREHRGWSEVATGTTEEMDEEPPFRTKETFLTLPDELLIYIGGFLLERDLLNYTLVRNSLYRNGFKLTLYTLDILVDVETDLQCLLSFDHLLETCCRPSLTR